MLLWSIEPKINWNKLLTTIESKNLVAIMIVSNSGTKRLTELKICNKLWTNIAMFFYHLWFFFCIMIKNSQIDLRLPLTWILIFWFTSGLGGTRLRPRRLQTGAGGEGGLKICHCFPERTLNWTSSSQMMRRLGRCIAFALACSNDTSGQFFSRAQTFLELQLRFLAIFLV